MTKYTYYPEMKDSPQAWFGTIPAHWETRKLRNILSMVSIRNQPTLPLLSIAREKGVVVRNLTDKEENHNFIPDDLTNYKVIRIGQFGMNKMKAWQGSFGVSPLTGIVSPAYFVFDLHEVDGAFFHRAIRSCAYIPYFTQASDGVRIGQWDLSPARMREIPFYVPPLAEQAAIVRYLDHMDKRIRKAIVAKQKLIKLLEEQKQVIIHQAVTRGLDSEVPFEPSGVEWLGEVPEGWVAKRIFCLFAERKEKNRPDWPILEVSIAQGVRVAEEVDSDGRPKRLIEDRGQYKVAHKNDIAYNMMRMWQGAVGVVPENGLVSPAYVVARPKRDIIPAYFTYVFRTEACKGVVRGLSRGIVDDRNRLYWEGFKDLHVPVPPIQDQQAIVDFLTRTLAETDTIITRARSEISLLQEYRTRLIADVVTGKVDVRDTAAGLPVEAAQSVPEDLELDDDESDELEEEDATEDEA